MSQTKLNHFFTQAKKKNPTLPGKKLTQVQGISEQKDVIKTIASVETVPKEKQRGVSLERISKKDAFDKHAVSEDRISDLQVSQAKLRASSCSRASTDDSRSNELSGTKKTAKANVTFLKKGALSPRKVKPQSPFKVERSSFLSPKRLEAIDALVKSEISASPRSVSKKLPFKTPEKPSPADVKKRLGSTNKLQELQARLKGLTEEEKPTARKALFVEESSISIDKKARLPSASPTLSRKAIDIDVEIRKQVVTASPVKASPRKQALEKAESVADKTKDLLQASSKLPLPQSYKDLLEVFKKIDGIVACKHNTKKAIPVAALKKDVKIALRKELTDQHLLQIRCVLPKAYLFIWEPKKDERGRPMANYELYISPILEVKFTAMDCDGHRLLKPREQVEREKMFEYSLLTIVQDHHQEFLKGQGIDLDNSKITKWDNSFDVNKFCPPIDEFPFPEKPYVESPERNPQAMLAKITGQNQNVEKALKRVIELTTPTKEQQENVMTPISKAISDDIELDPKLRDLPKHVRDKIIAKQREKRIRDMTMDETKQKEIELLKELLYKRFFTSFVNCHNTHKKGKALPLETLRTVTAQSCGKNKNAVSELLELFIKVCPEVFRKKVINKVEQVLGEYRKEAPDFDAMEKKIQDALNKTK